MTTEKPETKVESTSEEFTLDEDDGFEEFEMGDSPSKDDLEVRVLCKLSKNVVLK